MSLRFVRRRALPDGRLEEFTPKREDGYYVLADRAVDPQHNKAVNKFFVSDPAAVAARLRRGGVSLRMRGNITGQENLISAKEIVIEDAPAPVDDPFATFTEWAGEADDAAYRDL